MPGLAPNLARTRITCSLFASFGLYPLLRPMPHAHSPSPFAFAIQGVRALPSFHFWKGSKQVDSISGAKAQTLQDAIETHMN